MVNVFLSKKFFKCNNALVQMMWHSLKGYKKTKQKNEQTKTQQPYGIILQVYFWLAGYMFDMSI